MIVFFFLSLFLQSIQANPDKEMAGVPNLKTSWSPANLVVDQPTNDKAYLHFYNITADGKVLAYLNLTKGPMWLELAKKTSNGLEFSKNAVAKLDAVAEVTATSTTTADEQKLYNIKLNFKDVPDSKTEFVVQNASLELNIQVGGPSRKDYWNLTSASIDLSFSLNKTATQTLKVDLTPRMGYSKRAGDTSCQLGYGLCAPLNLCWTCNDQVLKQADLTSIATSGYTVRLHMPGLKLQPGLGKPLRWGYAWDCEAWIPLSIWVGLLISLFLASIVLYALTMLNSVFGPSKFDDPKGPSIHVPQAD